MVRATKMVVGVGIKDMKGSMSAMKKAIALAQSGDEISAVHVPSVMPEMMLSSMSDPSDASDDTFMQLASLPTKAGEGAQSEMKADAERELAASGKAVDLEFKVASSATDVKNGLLTACRDMKA